MSELHAGFYAANAARSYPIDEAASGVDDLGGTLPRGILVDAAISFPDTAGGYLRLASAHAGPAIVTLVFAAHDRPIRPAGGAPGPATPTPPVPVASLTVLRPVPVGLALEVTPLLAGVAGWVVLGPDTALPYTGRFSTPRQSQLLPRCAHAYPAPRVPSVAVLGAAVAATGRVEIQAGGDLVITPEVRSIGGVDRDCLVFSLPLDPKVLKAYAGPCGGRPDSGTCPQGGITKLGTAVPDAAGDLRISFVGITPVPAVDGAGAIGLATTRDVSTACPVAAVDPTLNSAADQCAGSGGSFMLAPPPMMSAPMAAAPVEAETPAPIAGNRPGVIHDWSTGFPAGFEVRGGVLATGPAGLESLGDELGWGLLGPDVARVRVTLTGVAGAVSLDDLGPGYHTAGPPDDDGTSGVEAAADRVGVYVGVGGAVLRTETWGVD